MRHSWPFTILICLVLAGMAGAALLMPSPRHSETCRRYAEVPGIEATFVRDYRLNDTLRVDVTLLEATTDSAWALLRRDFCIPDDALALVADGNELVASRLAPKGRYTLSPDSLLPGNDVVGMALLARQVAVFHVTDSAQVFAILHHNYESVKLLTN